MGDRDDLLPGTLDLLILRAVSLYCLEQQGLLDTEWGVSENKRRAKFYALTAKGRKGLRLAADSWARLVAAITAALNTTPGEV
jgi:DNA-binding PadR family transcriptional regulator